MVMPDASRLLRFSRSEWPVFVPRLAEVADELRTAIAGRDWERASEVSVRLGAVADGVVGRARSLSESGDRPDPDTFEAFDALFKNPLLGLRIPLERWAEVVNGYAFLRLAVGWSNPFDLVQAALCGGEVGWPALEAELTEPGVHPEMRLVENLFGTNAWRQVEKYPWPCRSNPIATVVSNLSGDARSTLATLGGLRQRCVVELRMAAHTMKFSEDRLVAAFLELQAADLAEFPASFDALANELTGAELKGIAVDVGTKRAGKKAELVRRLIDEGHAKPIADAINRRGLYHPVALGPISESLSAERAAAGLWTALWEDTSGYWQEDGGYGLLEDEVAADPGASSDHSRSTEGPKGARWAFPLGGGVADHTTVGNHLVVFTHQGTLHSVDESGEQRWELQTGESKADYSPALIDSDDGLFVVTAAAIRLVDPSDGRVSWTWVAPSGPIVQRPAIRDARMYVVTEDGLHAVRIAGDHLWQFSRKRLGAPALGSETVVVTRAGEMLNILDADTGDLVHRETMHGLPRTWAPLVSQDLVLLCGYRNGRWLSLALDARSGERVWSHAGEYLDDVSTCKPPLVIVDALHASADADLPHSAAEIRRNLLRCVQLSIEAQRDEDEGYELGVTTGPDRYSMLAHLGDTHVVADHHTLWGIRLDVPAPTLPGEAPAPLSMLRERWKTEFEGHGPSLAASLSPIGLSDSYVAVAAGLRVLALERIGGALRWSSEIVSTSVHCAGPVCYSVYAEHIHAIDAMDGASFWGRRLDAEIANIAYDAHSLFIVTEDGGSTCLDAASGRIRWRHSGDYRSPVLIEDEDPAREVLGDGDFGWASELIDGRFQWSSPDGVIRAVDAATGADAIVVEEPPLISNGWVDEWLDTENSDWWRQRTFKDCAIRLVTSGSAWDVNHRGALVIGRHSEEVLHHLQPGWQYDRAVLAADGSGVAMLAERQREYLDVEDDEEIDDPGDGRRWLLSVGLDAETGVVVEHGGRDRGDVSYDDLAVEGVPRDLAAHRPKADNFDDAVTEHMLTVWLFEGDST